MEHSGQDACSGAETHTRTHAVATGGEAATAAAASAAASALGVPLRALRHQANEAVSTSTSVHGMTTYAALRIASPDTRP